MIFHQDEELLSRRMEDAGTQVFYDEYTVQGWHPYIACYHMQTKEQAEGKCVALTAVYQGQIAVSLHLNAA